MKFAFMETDSERSTNKWNIKKKQGKDKKGILEINNVPLYSIYAGWCH